MIQALKKLHEQRIDGFLNRLRHLWYEDEAPLALEYQVFHPMPPFDERLKGAYRPLLPGVPWGKNWDRAWFHATGRVPAEWKGRRVVARLNLGCEGLAFASDGTPLVALSVHTIWPPTDFRRDRVDIIEKAQGGENVDLWIEASAGQLFGLKLEVDRGNLIPKTFGRYEAAVTDHCLAVFRKDVWELWLDASTLAGLMRGLPEKNARRSRILGAMSKAMDMFADGSPDNIRRVRAVLAVELRRKSAASDLRTTAVGHAHLDTAWLWPVEETKYKCGRTFATQASLIESYPGYVFGASQAQHYAWVKEHYPRLYEKIKKLVAAGRWEILGGMWVEADCNLISGESMIRQLLHGMNFFSDEFGVKVRNLWLPDVFGYSASMPQILRKCGLDSFITHKLSWNQFNHIPHNTFRWQGIDGTEIVTHFPPEENYNSELQPAALVRARENFIENDVLDEFLTVFGIGDGGCGPTEEIIETGLRQRDLEGAPRVAFGRAQDFLDRLGKKKNSLETWSGELYFEYHRGTYTSQAANKKMNRRLELALRELEMLYAALPWNRYPAEELDRMWKKTLLLQFHDIIPGSSVSPVYEDSDRDYQDLWSQSRKMVENAGRIMFDGDENSLCLVNTLSVPYVRPVELPPTWLGHEVLDGSGSPVAAQREEDRFVVLADIPAMGSLTLRRGRKIKKFASKKAAEAFTLENELIRYEFSSQGTISRAYDKEAGRDVLPRGAEGNILELYEDRPVNWDAWDIDIFYENQLRERARLVSRRRIADGPVRQGFLTRYGIGRSTIIQRIYLPANSKRLDFETGVEWREDHKLLRASFAADVQATEASFEIQFGCVRRPNHRNTSWDMAKFEVVGHRFADLSDRDYGIAILNDSKYGHKILGNVLSLSLLRAPTLPDPGADRGKHDFVYGFLPHIGDLASSAVLAEAMRLNQPPARLEGFDGRDFRLPFRLEGGSVVLDTVKKAEKDDAAVLRFYEPLGRRDRTMLRIDRPKARVYECDLMEREIKPLPLKKGAIGLMFKPFEIKTLKIK